MAGLIISVITNKGGTGKTTNVVSLGQALVCEGKKILVVDNDSQRNASNILLEGLPCNSLFEILIIPKARLKSICFKELRFYNQLIFL